MVPQSSQGHPLEGSLWYRSPAQLSPTFPSLDSQRGSWDLPVHLPGRLIPATCDLCPSPPTPGRPCRPHRVLGPHSPACPSGCSPAALQALDLGVRWGPELPLGWRGTQNCPCTGSGLSECTCPFPGQLGGRETLSFPAQLSPAKIVVCQGSPSEAWGQLASPPSLSSRLWGPFPLVLGGQQQGLFCR